MVARLRASGGARRGRTSVAPGRAGPLHRVRGPFIGEGHAAGYPRGLGVAGKRHARFVESSSRLQGAPAARLRPATSREGALAQHALGGLIMGALQQSCAGQQGHRSVREGGPVSPLPPLIGAGPRGWSLLWAHAHILSAVLELQQIDTAPIKCGKASGLRALKMCAAGRGKEARMDRRAAINCGAVAPLMQCWLVSTGASARANMRGRRGLQACPRAPCGVLMGLALGPQAGLAGGVAGGRWGAAHRLKPAYWLTPGPVAAGGLGALPGRCLGAHGSAAMAGMACAAAPPLQGACCCK